MVIKFKGASRLGCAPKTSSSDAGTVRIHAAAQNPPGHFSKHLEK
jgi:hypothetical protein